MLAIPINRRKQFMISKVTATLSLLICMSSSSAKPPADWQFKEWPAAVAQSEAEKKPLLVLFGFEGCEWCEYLYRRGMNDTALRTKYQSSVILTYIDTKGHRPEEEFALPGGAKIAHSELIKRYQAYPTPSWVFLAPNGATLGGNRSGKTTTREMLRDVEQALAKQ